MHINFNATTVSTIVAMLAMLGIPSPLSYLWAKLQRYVPASIFKLVAKLTPETFDTLIDLLSSKDARRSFAVQELINLAARQSVPVKIPPEAAEAIVANVEKLYKDVIAERKRKKAQNEAGTDPL